MTTILLVRHAWADHVGNRIAGRAAGLHLDERGRSEAQALASFLAPAPLAAVYTSPLERARETADALAEPHGLEPRVLEAVTEIDFGDWTGRSYEELENDEAWRHWNEFRSTARVPGGEAMADVLCRVLAGIGHLTERHRGEHVAVVSHCDVIRPLLLHFLGMPLDHLLRMVVDTASVSTVEVHPWGPRVLHVNRTPAARWESGGPG